MRSFCNIVVLKHANWGGCPQSSKSCLALIVTRAAPSPARCFALPHSVFYRRRVVRPIRFREPDRYLPTITNGNHNSGCRFSFSQPHEPCRDVQLNVPTPAPYHVPKTQTATTIAAAAFRTHSRTNLGTACYWSGRDGLNFPTAFNAINAHIWGFSTILLANP
jgi:hypothetical protein